MDNSLIASLTLEQLRDQYCHDLFDDFLPFMDKYVIDHEYGGFMCNTDRDGTNLSTDKNSWFIGRGIWVYSFLYNNLKQEEIYLDIARKAAEFILKAPPEGNDLWHVDYTREGRPKQPKGIYTAGKYVPVSKEIYGDLFIAHGFAEYARATADDTFWSLAKDIILKCARVYDCPDYAPSAVKVYLGNDSSELPGARLGGVWMLLLRLSTRMLERKHDPDLNALSDRCLDAIFNYHYIPEYDLINEVLNHDMSRPDNEYKNMVYTGHAIELLWMVLDEACRRKDKELFDKAAKMFKRHLEVAWDGVYGGFFRCLKNVDENTWILDKALWLQEESLIGCLIIIEHTDADWARNWFAKVFRYVYDNFPLKKHGFPLWDIWPDRKATFVRHCQRIENFHHPRHLMLNLLCIERMIERGAKTSDVFA